MALNELLAAAAPPRGWWHSVDPWTDVRATDDWWAASFVTDSAYTSPGDYQAAASSIARELQGAGL